MARTQHNLHRILLCALAPWLLVASSAHAAAPSKADCAKIYEASKKDSIKANPDEVNQCIMRGWDPPKSWKRDEGKSPGIRASGAGGFSYGAIAAPDAPPGKVGARASVKKEVMNSACNFPPRIKIGNPPTITFPAGSCFDFMNGLIKDKDDGTSDGSLPGGVSPDDACPAESDTTGMYGVKAPIAANGRVAPPCGGMIPLSTVDVILNRNPVGLATTEANYRYIWFYKRVLGGNYKLIANKVDLPHYLCMPTGPDGAMEKSVDLTGPISQMITYSEGMDAIAIRLTSRQSLMHHWIPPYNENDPEKYLWIPIGPDGTPEVPDNCALETSYFGTADTVRADIKIQYASNNGCEGNYNSFSPLSEIPSEALCASSNASEKTGCDIIRIHPKGTCTGQLQYGVLKRPNLYLPPAALTALSPVEGRTMLMADTTPDSQIFTPTATLYTLQGWYTPPLTFNEGGTIKLKDRKVLIMNQPATVNATTRVVTLPNGGQIVSGGGTQLQSLSNGISYTIPPSLVVLPMEVEAERSVTMPQGFAIPTAPKVGEQPPYIRLPVTMP